jgi:hypothetical protein
MFTNKSFKQVGRSNHDMRLLASQGCDLQVGNESRVHIKNACEMTLSYPTLS